MISVYVICPTCSGDGGAFGAIDWDRCKPCDGLGRVWGPGAPAYGCDTTLGDAGTGEIVTLGNGEQGRVLWHCPRRKKKIRPETTFLGMIEPFTEIESYTPTPYPSCVGVRTVDQTRATIDDNDHENERGVDLNDPVQRDVAGRLM